MEAEVITASLSTVSWRAESLPRTVASILPQVDRLNVFLQGYPSAPACLDDPKVTIVHGQDQPKWLALGGSAKFYWLCSGLVASGYHFTIDDDIVYPPDYVRRCIERIDRHGRKVAVGYHGVVYRDPCRNVFRDRDGWRFADACPEDSYVHVIGTGTLAHHTSTLKLSYEDFGAGNSCDIWFGIACQNQRVPLLCLARPTGYLTSDRELDQDERAVSAQRGQGERQAGFVNSWAPWRILRPTVALPPRPVVVVIPCHNPKPGELERSVESALAVPGVDLVRIVDDGSDVSVPPSVDPRIDVVTRSNGGPAAALNTGIRSLPRDTVVCRLDVGDVFYPEAKARQIALVRSGQVCASASPSLDPVAGTVRPFNQNWRKDLYRYCTFAGPTVVFEKSAWEDVGGFDESYRWAQDFHFLVSLHFAGLLTAFEEVTCEAGMYSDGHSDTRGDPDRTSARQECLRRADEYARMLQCPEAFKHLFNERWCKKRGIEPLRLPGRR